MDENGKRMTANRCHIASHPGAEIEHLHLSRCASGLARVVGGVNIAASKKLAAAQRPALDSVVRFLDWNVSGFCRLNAAHRRNARNRSVRQQFSRQPNENNFLMESFLCAVRWCSLVPRAAAPVPGTRLKRRRRPGVRWTERSGWFTTMLRHAGFWLFEADVSAATCHAGGPNLRDRIRHQQGPAVEVFANFYKQHELGGQTGAMLSRYIWFGLVSGPAAKNSNHS